MSIHSICPPLFAAAPLIFFTLSFSDDGKLLVAGARDGFVRLWDVASRELRQTYSGHQGLVWSVGLAPDGKTISSAGQDRTLIFWEKETGQEIARVNFEFENNTLVFLPDRSTTDGILHKRGFDQKIRFEEARCAIRHRQGRADSNINSVAIAPSGDSVGAVDNIGAITLWDAATGNPEIVISNPQRHLQSVEFSPDGKLIAVAGENANQEPVVELRDAGSRANNRHAERAHQVCDLRRLFPRRQNAGHWQRRPTDQTLGFERGTGTINDERAHQRREDSKLLSRRRQAGL